MGRIIGIGLAALLVPAVAAGDDAEFFEAKVRPVLATHCVSCHGPEKQKAGLRLDTPEGDEEGRRVGAGRQPRQARGEPARRGDLLSRRLAPDAPEGEAGRRRDRGARPAGSRPAPSGPSRRPRDRPPRSRPAPSPRRTASSGRSGRSKNGRAAAGEGRGLAEVADRPLHPRGDWRAKGLSPVAPADKRTLIRRVDVRPDRPAADARGGRRVPRTTTRPRPSRRSSTGCSPRRITASAGAGTGSTSPATARTRPTRSRPALYPARATAIATGSSTPSTPTCPTTASSTEQIAGDLLAGPPRPARPAGRARLLRRSGPVYYGGSPTAVADERDDQLDTLSRGVPRPDRRLRPLPRPQVRPDPDDRLLRPGRDLREHRSTRSIPTRRPRRSRRTTRPRRRSRPRRARSTRSSRPRAGRSPSGLPGKRRRGTCRPPGRWPIAARPTPS